MLTTADADLVRREPALPGLATLLDADAFAELLRVAVSGLATATVRPVYVRYKPGTRCLVSYELDVAGARVLAHASAYASARRVSGKAPASPDVPRPLGAPRVAIEEQRIVVSLFPEDSVLKSLGRLWASTADSRLLKKVLPGRPALWRGTLDVLAYKPGRRCVARLTGAHSARTILKAYTTSGFGRAWIGNKAFRSCGLMRVARLVGRSRRHHLLALEWLPGDRLADLIARGHADGDCLRRVGVALAMLHGQPGCGLSAHGRDAGREALEAVARGIGSLCPGLADRATRLAREIGSALARSSAESSAEDRPLHGDFYAQQVLVASETINVIDLDRASLGDPRADLANLAAHLECDALDGGLAPAAVPSLRTALLAGYQEVAPWPLAGSIDVHTAAALLRLAPRPFRTRQTDWPARTTAILDRAESLLADGTRAYRAGPRGVASLTLDPFNVLADRELSLSVAALDPAAVEQRLARLAPFRNGDRPAVRAIRVRRHKPGRRCLIEYDVAVARGEQPAQCQTVVAKVRAKGADTRTYDLACALWSDGFRDDSADGISVPEPLGLLPDLNMWLQRKSPGIPATMLLNQDSGREVGERAAEAIRKLHRSGVEAARRHGLEDELRILRNRLLAVSAQAPALRSRLDEIFDSCARCAASLPVAPTRGIHRDFHPDQLLVDADRAYLLDLDLYAEGDPALDAGNFLAHVTEHSLRAFGDPDRLSVCETALMERFLALDATASARAIEIYKTLSLARHIHISTLFPERRLFTERLVELCEARLGLSQRGPVSSV